jgi:predicted transcriptional regulator
MRTTIEIRDDLRARLLALAAKRRQKGFSRIIEEALERYFRDEEGRSDRLARVLALRGTLSAEDAAEIRAEIGELRRNWRTR